MTTEKFITMLVAYYGINAKADAVKLSVVTEYVAQFSDMQRKELFNKAIALFAPTSTNPYPIVVHLHGFMHSEADVAREAAEAWRQLEIKSNRYRSIAIEDPRISYALDRIGGWITFCDRTVQSEQFIRRDFLQAYAMASEATLSTVPKVYHGELDRADEHMIYLGNESAIKTALLEQRSSPVMVAFDDAAKKLSAAV